MFRRFKRAGYTNGNALTAVVLKAPILWMTLCSSLKVDRIFGGIYCLHLQVPRISQARNQHEAGSKFPLYWILAWLFFDPVNGGYVFLRKVG
jgi:hypothetical protein